MHVFYVPGTSVIFDVARKQGGQWYGMTTGKSLEQLEAEQPGVIINVLSYDEVDRAIISAVLSQPVEEVSKEAFQWGMDSTPPVDMHRRSGGEVSFKLGEPYRPGMSVIFARQAGRYWKFYDLNSLRHDQIIERIVLSAKEPA